MTWISLSILYAVILSGSLLLWNRQLDGLLTLYVVACLIGMPLSAIWGLPLVCALTFPFGILLSLLGWWYSAQLVKPSKIRIVRRLSVTLILLLQAFFVLIPISIWVNWKISLAIIALTIPAWMKAGAVSTDRFVLGRAKEIHMQNPQRHFSEAVAQAEQEMRRNVNDDEIWRAQ